MAKKRIYTFRTKTDTKSNVPLLPQALSIIEKYKNVTFHMARHLFATTITLTNGIPIETVSNILGHTRLRTTQIYAKVLETKVSSDMLALKKTLAKKVPKLPV